MWIKLLRLDIKKAFQFSRNKHRLIYPQLTKGYQKMLINKFKEKGLPNIFQEPRFEFENHPWHRRPIGKDRKMQRVKLKQDLIKSNIPKIEQEILQYRQQRINERPLKGMEKFLYEFGHSYANSLK